MADYSPNSPLPTRLAQSLATSGSAGAGAIHVPPSELVALTELWLRRISEHGNHKRRYLLSQWQNVADHTCAWILSHDTIPTWVVLYSGSDALGAIHVKAQALCRMVHAWPIRHYDLVITTSTAPLGMHMEHNFNAHQDPGYFPDGPIEVIPWDIQG